MAPAEVKADIPVTVGLGSDRIHALGWPVHDNVCPVPASMSVRFLSRASSRAWPGPGREAESGGAAAGRAEIAAERCNKVG